MSKCNTKLWRIRLYSLVKDLYIYAKDSNYLNINHLSIEDQVSLLQGNLYVNIFSLLKNYAFFQTIQCESQMNVCTPLLTTTITWHLHLDQKASHNLGIDYRRLTQAKHESLQEPSVFVLYIQSW